MISLRKCMCSMSSKVYRRYSKDPGISKRRAALSNPLELEQDFENLELDDLEADFMDVHKSYKEHRREMVLKKERLKYQIVKQKYFKEKFPNFLTWNDKEQIKFLHNKDPEEWTVEKLSESFPALPETVQKILKGKFLKSDSKIKNHDTVVEKNWEDLKAGKFENLPSDLIEHLNKFTARKLNTHVLIKKQEIINRPKIKSEFSEIITSYEKLKNKHLDNEISDNLQLNIKNEKHADQDTYLLLAKKKMKDLSPTTLSHLQEGIKNKAVKGNNLTQEEQIIYDEAAVLQPEENAIALNQEDVAALSENKYNTGAGSLIRKTERDYSHLIYPEKIVIPKELKKRGYTYRLNDCYYDVDGEFLYRVPGMDK